jgi:hypothetical protein
MRVALLQLGFAGIYHMIELWEQNLKDDALGIKAYQAKFEGKDKPYGREEWDRLLGHCMTSLIRRHLNITCAHIPTYRP